MDIAHPFRGQLLVTPECAAWGLAFNLGNRRLRKRLVEYVRRQIENNEWQEDHPQPIVFSARRLIDGQHRLQAIHESGYAVIAQCVLGVRDDLREYIDTGISRGLEDRCAFSDDLGINKRVASLISALWTINKNAQTRVTPGIAWDMFKLHEEALLWAAENMVPHSQGITTTYCFIAVVEFYERQPALAREFVASLLKPDGDIQQAAMLRDWLIKNRGGGNRECRERYGKSVSAMKAHEEGREIRQLRVASWV